MFPLTFDWAQIAYIGSPLLTPWWAAANVVVGLIAVMWVAAPIMCRFPCFALAASVDLLRLQKSPVLFIHADLVLAGV